jgi:leucyl-tRNA synthetase
MAPPAADGAPKGTARRDKLHELEEKAQAKWDKANAFEVDAPEGKWDGGKFMATFPYPYMNGLLHIGHGFSCSKAEFAVAFQRLQGKKAIFPFAFHCTGMPIQAAAVKLKKEYDLYGSPVPNFPPSPPEVVELDAELGSITIGWKLPTSTGGKPLSACRVLLRTGPADAEFVEIAKLPAAEAGPGGQCSFCASGLTVGTNYSFKVVSVVEGLPGVESKTLEKSADGKHALALMAPKDDGKKGGGGGGGKKAAKTKTVAKTGGMMTQWDILRSMGLAIEDIPPFVDPTYWLRYFPPLGKQDLKRFGCGIDWRRTFITTDYNAYYDSFVRWQFYKLREANVVAFGKRPSIYSEADGQPCMDHDRDKGEGVGNQEYTAIKIEVLAPLPAVLAPLAGKKVYCLAGTLRPETMCGQTNAWILPEGDYGAFDAGGGAVYLCAARAARNMGFQDLLPAWGSPPCLLSFKGSALIGAALKAPATSYDRIYMLPLTTISMTKGTAIVTSVPSDSPDDYAAFMDLKNPKKREFYGVKAEWVDPFELLPVLETPDLGRLSAEKVCKDLKVQSQKDVEKLKEAHDLCYTSGFYKGVMIAGPFVGKTVQEAKPLCRQKLIDDGEAFTYFEPDGLATPRSTPDVECVVALVDQWYLKYGDAE